MIADGSRKVVDEKLDVIATMERYDIKIPVKNPYRLERCWDADGCTIVQIVGT